MADKKKSVSQSRTMWVTKGTVVNGKKVPKGYLAQYGKPEKKVTANVKMVQDTVRGAGTAKNPIRKSAKAGESVRYREGRRVKAKPAAATAARSATARSGGGGGGPKNPPAKPNANVDVGTIRVGAAGRATNRWNGKRWVKVASEPQRKPSNTTKPAKPSGTPSNYQNLPTSKPKPAAKPTTRSGGSGGRGVGLSSVGLGSALQGRIRGLEKRISDARAQLKANAAKAASNAAARAQAERDRQLIRDLEEQLRNLR